MAVLSAPTMARLRELPPRLAFADPYDLLRPVSGTEDQFGNTVGDAPAVVETGFCRLKEGGLQPQERVMAERLGWSQSYAVDLAYGSLASPVDRIRIGNRTFEIGGVVAAGQFATVKTLVVREVG